MSTIVKIAGVDVHIEGAGAETLVMIHGWPDTHRVWDSTVAHFKTRYRCVCFELPGYEPGAACAYTIAELTGIFRQICEQVNSGKPVLLLVHDWGCFFGGQFAMRHPQLIQKMVCVDVGDPKSLEKSVTLGSGLMILAYHLTLALAWKLGGRIGAAINRFMARALGYRLDTDYIHANMAYPYWLVWFGRRKPGNEVVALEPPFPFMFMYARRKPVMFHAQSWLDWLRSRPGNAVVEMDTGHWVMVQQPEQFNQVIGDWFLSPPA